MSAENIRVSSPCEFESEVSGSSAVFDSFSTSETGSVELSVGTNSIRPVNSEAPVAIEGQLSCSSLSCSGETSFSTLSTSGDILCSGTIRGNRLQSTASETSSIEMSAEGISFSGNCSFESEVSGNSALFDSVSSSEIRCRPSSGEASELSILRDERSNAYFNQ